MHWWTTAPARGWRSRRPEGNSRESFLAAGRNGGYSCHDIFSGVCQPLLPRTQCVLDAPSTADYIGPRRSYKNEPGRNTMARIQRAFAFANSEVAFVAWELDDWSLAGCLG